MAKGGLDSFSSSAEPEFLKQTPLQYPKSFIFFRIRRYLPGKGVRFRSINIEQLPVAWAPVLDKPILDYRAVMHFSCRLHGGAALRAGDR